VCIGPTKTGPIGLGPTQQEHRSGPVGPSSQFHQLVSVWSESKRQSVWFCRSKLVHLGPIGPDQDWTETEVVHPCFHPSTFCSTPTEFYFYCRGNRRQYHPRLLQCHNCSPTPHAVSTVLSCVSSPLALESASNFHWDRPLYSTCPHELKALRITVLLPLPPLSVPSMFLSSIDALSIVLLCLCTKRIGSRTFRFVP
jgi:hypothetical protein